LQKIAEKSYLDSRYYFDQRYPREICAKFYSDWIEKSCKGFADKVFVAKINRRVVGYITCDKKPDLESHRGCGRITLVGVDDSARGIGVGSSLVYHALNWFLKEKMREVIVVTQGRNYRAQRLYQECGFKTILTQLWYHKWFNLEDDK
jgi:ribosomal protein S18 acetylase RimI-like enzyme